MLLPLGKCLGDGSFVISTVAAIHTNVKDVVEKVGRSRTEQKNHGRREGTSACLSLHSGS